MHIGFRGLDNSYPPKAIIRSKPKMRIIMASSTRKITIVAIEKPLPFNFSRTAVLSPMIEKTNPAI